MAKKPKTNFEIMEEEARRGYITRKRREVSLWKAMNGDYIGPVYLGPFEILTSIGCLVLFSIAISNYQTHGLSDKTLFFIFMSLLSACLLVLPTSWRYLSEYVDFRTEVKRLPTSKIILEFQRSRIRDACELAIGKESEFSKTFEKEKNLHGKLCLMLSQLEAIVARDSVDDIFSNLLNEVRKKKEAMADVCRRKKEYEDRVRSFVEERFTEIRLLEDPLNRLELVREARALCDQANEAVANVEASIAESLMKLAAGFEEMRIQIAGAYEETGIALAVDVAGESASFDVNSLERVIAQHVPAPFQKKKIKVS